MQFSGEFQYETATEIAQGPSTMEAAVHSCKLLVVAAQSDAFFQLVCL